MKKRIIVKTNFVGFHRWKDAPEEVKFLRDFHRHIFFVEVWFKVDANRELEFFIMKKAIDEFLEKYRGKYFEDSCEAIAEDILKSFFAYRVRVSEDNENGGEVER